MNDSRRLAPNGWHIPGEKEWNVSMENLGGESKTGGKQKNRRKNILTDFQK